MVVVPNATRGVCVASGATVLTGSPPQSVEAVHMSLCMPTFYNIIHLVITFTSSNIIIITIILSLLIPIQPAWHCIILVPIPTDTYTSTYLPYIPRLYKNTYAHVNNYTQLCIPDAFRNSL